jgi:tRNA(Ile2) C34 agmatinyltransferase TiaS
MKEKLVIYGDNSPVCPKCGNGNAMLSASCDDGKRAYKCRDCNHLVKEINATLIYKELDKPGMMNNSTYTTVRVING